MFRVIAHLGVVEGDGDGLLARRDRHHRRQRPARHRGLAGLAAHLPALIPRQHLLVHLKRYRRCVIIILGVLQIQLALANDFLFLGEQHEVLNHVCDAAVALERGGEAGLGLSEDSGRAPRQPRGLVPAAGPPISVEERMLIHHHACLYARSRNVVKFQCDTSISGLRVCSCSFGGRNIGRYSGLATRWPTRSQSPSGPKRTMTTVVIVSSFG